MSVKVQAEDIDIGAAIAALTAGRADIGALATFTGLVRDINDGADVAAMTLEHYPGMTEKQLARMEAAARQRWPLQDCLIVHRYGPLYPGDRIVLVACAAEHRHAAFEACQFLMDYLKTEAPFWKQEETAWGRRWVASRESDSAARDRWGGG